MNADTPAFTFCPIPSQITIITRYSSQSTKDPDKITNEMQQIDWKFINGPTINEINSAEFVKP